MNILLINPKAEGYTRSVTLPLGLLSIASYLKANGHNVRLYDRCVEEISAENAAGSFKADIVGVSLISYKALEDSLYISEFYKKLNIPVIWGGPLASELPSAVFKYPCVDAVSIGEGEETWLELANAYENGAPDLSSISGLALRKSPCGYYLTPQRDFIDLASLPDTDWSLIDVPKYFQSSYGCRRMLYLYSAKGCPFSCVFCYNKDFHRCVYRKRPVDALLREIKVLVNEYGMDGVYFADELWCRNSIEMRGICDALKSLNLNFVWGCQTRIGMFSQEDLKYMANAGCRWIFFGVESGSKRILQKMNKRIAYEKIVSSFADCKKAGIVAIGSFIVGFPEETPEDLKKTIELIEQLDTSLINLNFFIVMPGSEIYKQMISDGRYPEITDLNMLREADFMLRPDGNYSEIPTRDMKVVQSWYMWRSFSSNNINVGSIKTSFTKKVISDALKSLRGETLKSFVLSSVYAAKEFLIIAFYAHFFPGIKKKYGIKKKGKN
ncbi:MAG: B12-binding domain-containing radical SAM protein [Oscillospiraceae bacterium]|nr:B12-binding domain-containing radical SAM protein [Oscillospiraceae bacterium]